MAVINPDMSTFDAIVTMALIVLRQRGQWQGGATSYDDIDKAVNNVADLLPDGTRSLCEMAVSDVKRRAGMSIAAGRAT